LCSRARTTPLARVALSAPAGFQGVAEAVKGVRDLVAALAKADGNVDQALSGAFLRGAARPRRARASKTLGRNPRQCGIVWMTRRPRAGGKPAAPVAARGGGARMFAPSTRTPPSKAARLMAAVVSRTGDASAGSAGAVAHCCCGRWAPKQRIREQAEAAEVAAAVAVTRGRPRVVGGLSRRPSRRHGGRRALCVSSRCSAHSAENAHPRALFVTHSTLDRRRVCRLDAHEFGAHVWGFRTSQTLT
jgi:hypothetical protein